MQSGHHFRPFAAAHRGLSAEFPENTLKAFGAAVAAGFPWVELDLMATRDGHIVILHDATVDRTTDGTGPVARMDLAELQRLDTGAGPVPTLEELLRMLKAWQGSFNLELKAPAAVAGTLELVRKFGLAGRVQLSSTDQDILWAIQDDAPGLPLGYIPFGPIEDGDTETARDAGCTWVNADHDFLDAEEVGKLQQAGFRVGAWTVNEPARARELVAMGVECIITDARAVHEAVRDHR